MHPYPFRRCFARTTAACLVLLALAAPRIALAAEEASTEQAEPSGAEMMADMGIHRPLGLARTLIGTGVWIVSLPFTVLSGDVGTAGEKLIVDPARHTFARPLGVWRPVEH